MRYCSLMNNETESKKVKKFFSKRCRESGLYEGVSFYCIPEGKNEGDEGCFTLSLLDMQKRKVLHSAEAFESTGNHLKYIVLL